MEHYFSMFDDEYMKEIPEAMLRGDSESNYSQMISSGGEFLNQISESMLRDGLDDSVSGPSHINSEEALPPPNDKSTTSHVCEVCGKSFSLRWNLNRHMIAHEKVKNVACSKRNVIFHRSDPLEKHMTTHEKKQKTSNADSISPLHLHKDNFVVIDDFSTTKQYNENMLNFSYYRRYLSAMGAKEISQRLENEIEYLSPEDTELKIYGKIVSMPRKMACFGDKGKEYMFSGKTFSAEQWPPVLKFLREVADEIFRNLKDLQTVLSPTAEANKPFFNFAVVNYYKDGNHSIGKHKDDEKDLDPLAPIISFSFRSTRKFIFRRPGYDKVENPLEDGSVLVMKPPTNKYWTHEIPKEKNISGPRINITFRRIM